MVDLTHLPFSLSLSLSLCLSCLFTAQRWTTSVMGTSCPNSFFSAPTSLIPLFFFSYPNDTHLSSHQQLPSFISFSKRHSFQENVVFLFKSEDSLHETMEEVMSWCGAAGSGQLAGRDTKFKNVNWMQLLICSSVWYWLNISSCYLSFALQKLGGYILFIHL